MAGKGVGQGTQANKLLEELLAFDDGDLRCLLGIAIEYADHPTIGRVPAMSAGNRMMRQLRLAMDEMKAVVAGRGKDQA